jgi:hypothetical protein
LLPDAQLDASQEIASQRSCWILIYFNNIDACLLNEHFLIGSEKSSIERNFLHLNGVGFLWLLNYWWVNFIFMEIIWFLNLKYF